MGLHELYQDKIRSGTLKPDPAQLQVMQALDDLARRLTENGERGFFRSLFGKRETARGLYIHGEVGRGKTMLMDLFFESLNIAEKRRVHFHAFMQDVHAARSRTKSDDVIAAITDGMKHLRILCLDEMQIVDIADAMIIGRLYEALLERNVTLVTTSNLPPEGLYRDGLNRQLFLPFIKRLRETMDVVALTSPKDYRLGRMRSTETFIHPLSSEGDNKLNALWSDLTDDAEGRAETVDVLGRKLQVPRAAHGCAKFSFTDLCEAPLGPPDYLALAKVYRTIFVTGIPVLQEHQRNEAKRFILMIDTFYDAGVRLAATAAAAPENLAPESWHGFEFQRTVSRLKEMQSASWWNQS